MEKKKINFNLKRATKAPKEPKEKKPTDIDEALNLSREKVVIKFAEKEKKQKEKALRKLEDKLNLGTPITNKVAELISSGVITKEDLVDEFGKVKNFLDVIEEFQDHPQDDEPEEEPEVESEINPDSVVTPFGGNIVVDDNNVSPAFTTNNYVIDENGEVHLATSSSDDAKASSISDSEIYDMIVSDPDIKSVYPSINRNDILIEMGLILIKIPKDNGDVELYRLDIVDNQIYVQAPLDTPVDNNTFISVPVCTDVGKEILRNENYVVKLEDVDLENSIFRSQQNEVA